MKSWPDGAPRPGDRAELSRRVEAADIELFTRISGDRNPLHYDEDAARASRFGEIIVQGGVTSAILNAVVAERLPGPGTVFLQVEWRFLAPVRPGDEITGAVEVLEVRQDKPITRLHTTVSRQDGTVVLEGTAVCYTTPPDAWRLRGPPRLPDRWGGDAVGDGGRLEAVGGAELAQDARDMETGCPDADDQALRDLAVGVAAGDEGEDLGLARGEAERLQAVPAVG